MSKLKVDQFIDVVKRSGLVDDERLTEVLSYIDESVKDSGVIASAFTKAGLLTEWQSEKLLQGKHKGFHLGKYKLLNHIGTGGMGAVYLAEHRVMRHRVAIKLLPNHMAAQTSYLERFHQEARASAQLNHPNMVRAFDVDKDGEYNYLVMEFVDGSDLQAVVSRQGPLEYHVAANYTRQAAQGLAYAHRVGLIHRDIKPANLLIDKEGTLKILDMGLARFSDDSQGSLTMAYDQKMIGTVDYLAPEQALDSHRVDLRADIYSLGCTLYFMLSGDAPFPQGTIPQRLMAHQKEEPADIRKTRPDAPDELLAICRKMMAKKADDRYQTADEIVVALTEYIGDGDTSPPPATYAPAPAGPSLNENLDLAPLEDEDSGRRRLTDSKAGGSKSGIGKRAAGSGVGKGDGSSVMSNEGSNNTSPTGASPSGAPSGSGVRAAGSGVKTGGKSGVKPGGQPAAPVPPLPNLNKGHDLMDELLNVPTVSSAAMSATPFPTPRKQAEHRGGFNIWVVIGVSLGVAGGIGVLFYGLLWALDSVRM
ncbi:MAG: serine/threonine protein kinase [Pirellulales bacterium]